MSRGAKGCGLSKWDNRGSAFAAGVVHQNGDRFGVSRLSAVSVTCS